MRPMLEEAVGEIYRNLLPEKMVVADLGCSSGPNTLVVLSEVIKIISNQCLRVGQQPPEMQFFLNDLRNNDFNNLFRSLDHVEQRLRVGKGTISVPYFVAGLPGSFYGGLFPRHSVHFFHSSYSLMWISQEQFHRDFSHFLKLRFDELVPCGQMVLSFLGRNKKDKLDGEMSTIYGLLAEALDSMVREGLVEEEKFDTFNLPLFVPSSKEVEVIVKLQGLYDIIHFQTFESNLDPFDDDLDDNVVLDNVQSGANCAKVIRSVFEPMIANHFGSAIVDDLFSRYATNVAKHLLKEKLMLPVLALSLKKKEVT
ncbi:anthranilate O-methyltransferase 3-like protein [Carex littledalei]|uniref:Anthranilate O-methyltransferase 3-like protein n=1 Tax=Carex littledalei TaxID=544730 RepID=A0A833RC93_9POAL|nr:anthranilate O-methyltransferase 3-like protein [Carex littledalei]